MSSEKLQKLRESMSELSVLEIAQLVKELEEHWGVSAAAPAVAVAAPQAAASAEEEKSEFDVVLKSAGSNKINVIKELRALTGLGLADAKKASETEGYKVKEGLSKAEAEDVAKKLREAGAEVSVE